MSESTLVPPGSASTEELITVLRRLQTSHLTPENAASFASEHPESVNPAMVVKGALLGVEQARREVLLQTVFDNAVGMRTLALSLDAHSPLSVTKAGQEGLATRTTSLLSHLGVVAAAFIDIKVGEVLPDVEKFIDVADDSSLLAGLKEAKEEMQTPGVRTKRYELVTSKWQTN